MTKFFKGIYTALITPFKDGNIDLKSLEILLNNQLEAKVDGIVIAGSTGEGSMLSLDEYSELLRVAAKTIAGKTQLISGVSANTPSRAIEIVKIAENYDVDGIMCVMPFYNRAPQRGLIKYFEAIHDATNIPIMLYTVPARTGIDFTDETIIELSKLPRILALKDAGVDIERPLRLVGKIRSDFSLISGEDTNCVAYSSHGGVGCNSVISNIAPHACKKLQDFLAAGDFASALKLQSKLTELCKVIFVDTNPIPIKFAASYMKLCSAEVRAPLYEMVDEKLKNNIMKLIDQLSREIQF